MAGHFQLGLRRARGLTDQVGQIGLVPVAVAIVLIAVVALTHRVGLMTVTIEVIAVCGVLGGIMMIVVTVASDEIMMIVRTI